MTKKFTTSNRLAVAAAFGLSRSLFVNDYLHRDKPTSCAKLCLNCGEPHTHHNSFCSPGCCEDYLIDSKRM